MFNPKRYRARQHAQGLCRRTLALAVLISAGGCSSSSSTQSEARDANASSTIDGEESSTSTDAAGAAQADAALLVAHCLDQPARRPGDRAVVPVTVDLTHDGKPVPHGEPLQLPSGGTLTISNFRFYLSDVTLLGRDGRAVDVDIVTADGNPVPYNVHLVKSDQPEAMTFQIAAPAGDYIGLSFVFGLNDACERREPSASKWPLTYDSQMTWPRPFGFLFLRYEGRVVGTATGETPTGIAMGGVVGTELSAPRVTARGDISVTAGAPNSVHMSLALEHLFTASQLPYDMPELDLFKDLPFAAGGAPGGPEVSLGEHLRQNANKVVIFSLTK